jgi:CheY-like chemotaxis protein
MQILVAEDDVRLGALLETALTEEGWEVEVVGDGLSAYGRALPGGLPYDVRPARLDAARASRAWPCAGACALRA